ncbi:MAG: anaerobic ribonucleoside-triphosphate reductase, partial [Actinobacteria bacterium]|nr:anaerobic ribonucleoside-triphosphate reductase [Actinomycetota bacterium]
QIPARRLLLEGFNTGHGHIRPAKRISSAMAQVAILIQSNQNEMHGGQSIADFDRALAPFVEREREYWRNILRGLGVEPAEEKLDRLTEQACYQAAEAFVHNSNSMHSLSGSERIWVHDKATGDVRQYSMEEFHLVFEPDRYQAFSLNYDTGRTELKDITASLGHENINRILKLRLKSGQSVKVTDNHSVMALDAEGRVTTARPEDLTAGLVPRAIDMVATDLGFDLTGYPRSYKHKFDYLPLTPELANFLGYYVAEGSVDGSSIYLAIFNEKLEEDVRALLSTISPTFTARVRVGVSGKPRDLVCNVGKTFSNFVGDVCGRGAAAKKIPGQLFFASNDVVRAFLDGYFSGDGTVGKNRVVASSVSKELRDGLQLLLAKLGIPATIRDYSPKTNFASAKRRYLISVGGYHARPEVIDELISDLEVRLASVDLEKVERLTRPEHLFEVVRQAAEPVTTSERIHLLKKVSNGDLPVRTKYLPVLADYSGTLRTLYLSEHRGKFILKNTRQCPKAVMRWAKLVLAQAGKMTELLEALRRCRELLPVKVRDIQSQPHEDYVYDISVAENENFLTAEGVFVHNSRAGAQVPFSSINLGTDTSTEGRMVTRAMLLAYEKGLGRGEHPLFPNIVFKVKDGVNSRPGDPNYDLLELAFRVSSTRLFPTYSFMDSSFNRIYDDEVAYMGCRTRVIGNVNGPEVTDGRGNLSFTSVNLPRVAFEALRNVWNIPEVGPDGARSDGSRLDADASAAALAAFFSRLDETLDLTKRQLLHRYNVQKNLKVKDFPFLMGQKLYLDSEGLKPDDPVEKAFRHGTLSIGFIGLAEALILLTGAHHAESAESLELADLIVGQMRQYCDRATAEESLNFSLLATPAEGLSGRFTKIDRKEFGIFPRVTDRDWYTNSFHVPVDFPVTGSKKIAIEGRFHKYCNAGHISYVELPSPPRHNSEVVEAIVRAMKEADMGYAGVNFPVDTCTACGYTNLIDGDTCPSCGSDEISRVRRITGYLSTLDRFNDAKRAEERNRKVHGL